MYDFEKLLMQLYLWAKNRIEGIGRRVIFAGKILLAATTTRPYFDRTVEQTFFIGVGALPIVILISAFLGGTLCIEFWDTYMQVGGGDTVGIYLTYAVMRETGPIMTGALIGAKAGAESAATIASMKVREQIDAIEVMGVDPIRYLVVPRLFALILVSPLLLIIGVAVSLGSGYLVYVYQLGGFGGTFQKNIIDWAKMPDIYNGLIKIEIMAVLILVVCAYEGFTSAPGSEGVGRATNRTIVRTTVLVALVNMALSLVIYGPEYLRF